MKGAIPRITFSLVENTKGLDGRVKKAIEDAMLDIGRDWEGRAKAATPVDSGRLRGSITHATATKPAEFTVGEATQLETKLPGVGTLWPTQTTTPVRSYMRKSGPVRAHARGKSRNVAFVVVGTNVEYAAPVHEGIRAQVSTVRRHWVRPYTRRDGVHVSGHHRGPFPRNTPQRNPTKFIEGPGRQMMPQYKQRLERAMKEAVGT